LQNWRAWRASLNLLGTRDSGIAIYPG